MRYTSEVSHRIVIVGVLNVSPESFYRGSVQLNASGLARAAKQMEKDGADIIDIGAMSTAPYLQTQISEDEETKRLAWAVAAVRRASRLPISADTSRFLPARAALDAGASYINDITGLHGDPKLASLGRRAKAMILMAHPIALFQKPVSPVAGVSAALRSSLRRAAAAGLSKKKIVLDPGIGFFRDMKWPWWQWDLAVLRDLKKIQRLGCDILAGVSRKSFLGQVLNQKKPEDRLAGSLAATLIAVQNGATWVRTHDVKATRDALLTYGALQNR